MKGFCENLVLLIKGRNKIKKSKENKNIYICLVEFVLIFLFCEYVKFLYFNLIINKVFDKNF